MQKRMPGGGQTTTRHPPARYCCSHVIQTATLLFTRCANSNGFCRCFAFQIGKICCHHDIIRHFQFRKCLPVYSNTATSFCFAHTSAHCRPHKFLRLSWCRCFFLLSCSLCLWRFVLRISVSSAIITAGTVTLFSSACRNLFL